MSANYDLDHVADALLAVDDRITAAGGVGAVFPRYGLDGDDVHEVISHLPRAVTATEPTTLMAVGLLWGLALARGDGPDGSAPTPDWVRGLFDGPTRPRRGGRRKPDSGTA